MPYKYFTKLVRPELFIGYSLVYMFLGMLQVLNHYVEYLTPVWAIYCIVFMLIHVFIEKSVKLRGLVGVMCVLGTYLLSTLVHYQIEFSSNLKVMVATSLTMLGLFTAGILIGKDKRRYIEMLYASLAPLLVLLFITSVISVGMLISNFSYTEVFNGVKLHLGNFTAVYDSGPKTYLLYGLYQDTNMITIIVCMSMLLSGYYIWQFYCKKTEFFMSKKRLCYFTLNLVVQYIYFAAANSRAAFLVFIGILVVTPVLYISKVKAAKQRWGAAIALSGLVVVLVYFSYSWVQKGIITYYENINEARHTSVETALLEDVNYRREIVTESLQSVSVQTNLPIQETSSPEAEVEEVPLVTTEKGHDLSENLRVYLWREAWEVYKLSPIWGISYQGVKQYITQYHIPSTYLVKGKAIHNSYLDVLVYYGALGIIAWCVFGGRLLVAFLWSRRQQLWHASVLLPIALLLISLGNSAFISVNFVGINCVFGITMLLFGLLYAISSGELENDVVSKAINETE